MFANLSSSKGFQLGRVWPITVVRCVQEFFTLATILHAIKFLFLIDDLIIHGKAKLLDAEKHNKLGESKRREDGHGEDKESGEPKLAILKESWGGAIEIIHVKGRCVSHEKYIEDKEPEANPDHGVIDPRA
jgi:hypothetical protein